MSSKVRGRWSGATFCWRAALDLEAADRVGGAEEVVGRRVVERQPVEVDGRALMARDQRDGLAHHVEALQGQHVELDQPRQLQAVLVPLDDDAVRHRRTLQRHQLAERRTRDDDAPIMNPEMARRADQLLAEGDEVAPERAVERGLADDRDDGPGEGVVQALAHAPGDRLQRRRRGCRAPCPRRAPRPGCGRSAPCRPCRRGPRRRSGRGTGSPPRGRGGRSRCRCRGGWPRSAERKRSKRRRWASGSTREMPSV